jgi:hypothetical protein
VTKPSAAELLKRAIAGTQQPEPTAVDLAIEWHRRSTELEDEWAAQSLAEQQDMTAPKTTAGILRGAIAEAIPLNGASVLNAAARAVGGSYDAGSSVAQLIQDEILKGRNE